MTTTQDAQDAVSRLTTSVEYSALSPIRKALDRLQQLERGQEELVNRELIARELFAKDLTREEGDTIEQLRSVWDGYLMAESFYGTSVDEGIENVLANYRRKADSFVFQLRTILA